jgi:hypothetical protein
MNPADDPPGVRLKKLRERAERRHRRFAHLVGVSDQERVALGQTRAPWPGELGGNARPIRLDQCLNACNKPRSLLRTVKVFEMFSERFRHARTFSPLRRRVEIRSRVSAIVRAACQRSIRLRRFST